MNFVNCYWDKIPNANNKFVYMLQEISAIMEKKFCTKLKTEREYRKKLGEAWLKQKFYRADHKG